MIQTHVLPNGLTILMERLPYLRSAAIGIFVKAGSIMEQEHQNGLSHFIEHMAFKGTTTRSARQINEEIDLIGGNVNAATSKLSTTYYARTTDKELKKALDLLADLVVNPKEEQADFEKERQVILEEIGMEADDPQDLVFNLAHKGLYGEQTLARTILGTREHIKGYSLADLQSFRSQYYQPGNAVLAVAGRFEPHQFISWAEQAFAGWMGEERKPCPKNSILPGNQLLTQNKDVEQVHLCLSYKGLSSLDDGRHALAAFATAFGGGVSSRMFLKIREEQGLVYSIYAAPSFYPDCGEFTIFTACSTANVKKVLALVQAEVELVQKNGISRREFEQTMAQIKTSFVLGMESAYQRMAIMGNNMLIHNRIQEPKETLALLRKLSLSKVNQAARAAFAEPPKLALVGRQISRKFKQEMQDGQA